MNVYYRALNTQTFSVIFKTKHITRMRGSSRGNFIIWTWTTRTKISGIAADAVLNGTFVYIVPYTYAWEMISFEPLHEILLPIAYVQMPLINAHAVVSSKFKSLNSDLSFYLHRFFVHASSECSGESAHMRRLA